MPLPFTTTDSKSFRLLLKANTSYRFKVNWGDGSPTETVRLTTGTSEESRGVNHTYSTGNRYQIKITEIVKGGFPGLDYGTTTVYASYDAKKIKNVIQWGTNDWGGSDNSIKNAFANCTTLQLPASDYTSVFSDINSFDQTWLYNTSLTSFPPCLLQTAQFLMKLGDLVCL